jgi:hypothetical protein
MDYRVRPLQGWKYFVAGIWYVVISSTTRYQVASSFASMMSVIRVDVVNIFPYRNNSTSYTELLLLLLLLWQFCEMEL